MGATQSASDDQSSRLRQNGDSNSSFGSTNSSPTPQNSTPYSPPASINVENLLNQFTEKVTEVPPPETSDDTPNQPETMNEMDSTGSIPPPILSITQPKSNPTSPQIEIHIDNNDDQSEPISPPVSQNESIPSSSPTTPPARINRKVPRKIKAISTDDPTPTDSNGIQPVETPPQTSNPVPASDSPPLNSTSTSPNTASTKPTKSSFNVPQKFKTNGEKTATNNHNNENTSVDGEASAKSAVIDATIGDAKEKTPDTEENDPENPKSTGSEENGENAETAEKTDQPDGSEVPPADPDSKNEEEEEYPSRMFIPIEERTVSELENLDLDELDFQQPPSKIDTMLWRIGIILICLVFIWITSFPVILAFLNSTIPSPQFSQVESRWGDTTQSTWSEIQVSKNCYSNGYDNCDQQLDLGIQSFRDAMDAIFQILDDGLDLSNKTYTPCGAQHTDIVRAFISHRELGYPIVYDSTACSEDEITKTKDLVGDSDSWAAQIINKINSIQSDWAWRFVNVTESVKNRTKYDINYFKLKFGQLNVTLDSIRNMALNVNVTLADLEMNLLSLPSLMFVPPLQPYPFESDIAAYISLFQSLWNSAKDLWVKAKQKAQNQGFPDLFPPIDMAFPNLDLSFRAVYNVLNSGKAYMSNEMAKKVAQIQGIGETFRKLMISKLQELEFRVAMKFDEIQTNFQPPSLDLDIPKLRADLAVKFDVQMDNVQNVIDAFAGEIGKAKSDVKDAAKELLDFFNPIPWLEANLKLVTISKLEWPLLIDYGDYQPILDTLAQINLVFFIFDIIYRVTSSMQMVINYGKMTQSAMPTIDMRKNSGDHNRFIDFISKLPYGMIGPALTVLTTLVFVVVMLLYIIFAYVRMYEGYVEGCVHSRNSTFVGDTAFTIAYNFANDTTRAIGAGRNQVYVAKRWGMCQNETKAVENEFQRKVNLLNLDRSSYISNRANLNLLDKCISKPLTFTNIDPIDSNGTMHKGRYLWTSSQNLTSTTMVEILTNSSSSSGSPTGAMQTLESMQHPKRSSLQFLLSERIQERIDEMEAEKASTTLSLSVSNRSPQFESQSSYIRAQQQLEQKGQFQNRFQSSEMYLENLYASSTIPFQSSEYLDDDLDFNNNSQQQQQHGSNFIPLRSNNNTTPILTPSTQQLSRKSGPKNEFELLNQRYPSPHDTFFRGKKNLFNSQALAVQAGVKNAQSRLLWGTLGDDEQDQEEQPEIYVSTNSIGLALGDMCSPFVLNSYPWNGFEQRLSNPGDCDTYIPACSVPSSSCQPSIEVITISTHYASCDSEWLLHSTLMKVIALVIMMICVNISRIFLVKFMIQYLYHRLGNVTVDIVQFYRYLENVPTITERERRYEIQKAVRSAQCRSTLWLALSLVIHIPWMVMVFMLMTNLAPMR